MTDPHRPRTRVRLGKIEIDSIGFREAVDAVTALARNGRAELVVTPNADHLVRLEEDAEFREVYRAASLVVADGMPLVWASRLIGPGLPERVSGSDLMLAVCERAAREDLPVFILGGPPGVAPIAATKLVNRYPGLRIVGCYSPPFGFEKDAAENDRIVGMINASGARIVFVGVGCPKQERWIHAHRTRLEAGVLLGVGAAIEFAAGTLSRAPAWMQKSGSEWLFRLCQDPKRLARRYARDFKVFPIFLRSYLSRRQVRRPALLR
jgi:N-acetylglucosaminyldiphosphoundecaprenol N-acetyl-beta-D-mannosaminyltransferase